MELKRLRLTNYKNYTEIDVSFEPQVNIIFGKNGAGKTNLLDAIHYLSVSKSYFPLADKYLIREGQDFFRIDGDYEVAQRKEHLAIKYAIGKNRQIQINATKLSKVQDLIGRYPVVMIAPDDIKIVKGASKDRRDYFNKWLSQADRSYLEAQIQYNRLLRKKDALLKQSVPPQPLSVESYNMQMIPHAKIIHARIKETMETFVTEVLAQYKGISGGQDEIGLAYVSELQSDQMAEQFAQKINDEIRVKRPLIGVQRDDYELTIRQLPIKRFGSQGQIKSYLYALRLAEYTFLRERLEKKPILLLDDYFEKLDRDRLSSLLSMVNDGSFGQVFLSDTELKRSQEIFEERGINFAAFEVTNGKVNTI